MCSILIQYLVADRSLFAGLPDKMTIKDVIAPSLCSSNKGILFCQVIESNWKNYFPMKNKEYIDHAVLSTDTIVVKHNLK